jgi:hypothetical protein
MEDMSLYSVSFKSFNRLLLLLSVKKKNAAMPMMKARIPTVPPIMGATWQVVDTFDESTGPLEDVVLLEVDEMRTSSVVTQIKAGNAVVELQMVIS